MSSLHLLVIYKHDNHRRIVGRYNIKHNNNILTKRKSHALHGEQKKSFLAKNLRLKKPWDRWYMQNRTEYLRMVATVKEICDFLLFFSFLKGSYQNPSYFHRSCWKSIWFSTFSSRKLMKQFQFTKTWVIACVFQFSQRKYKI